MGRLAVCALAVIVAAPSGGGARLLAGPGLRAQAGAPTVDYVQPARGPIVRHFEPPPTPYGAGHRGIDIAAPPGETVVAAAAGRVAFAGQVGGHFFVSIDHSDGLRSTYSFLSETLVIAGQTVSQGDPVALTGEGHPGAGTPALHFGVRRGSDYLDPEDLVAAGLRRNLWRAIWIAPAPG
ncbi:MAG: M23 family metallopeptidase [Acidobacteria bacterium]|nr:M23 family metallopeptidase [Acidobacteriota bacterium]